uniref:Uncharacterized protein n=1 Tax=Rhodnius prolixus TaxID=13249 RepID=T1HFW1_RHOPR
MAFTGIIGFILGLFIFVLAVSSLLVGAFPDDAPETPKADSKGTGKVETGDTNLADIKMSTEAEGKNVKSSTSMEATSSQEKGSTKGEAKTEVKGSRKKR